MAQAAIESLETVQVETTTEQRVLNSALTVFSEKGYEGAHIREIIERAGVTRPVLYYYFKSKEDLFCRLMEKWFSDVNARLDVAINDAMTFGDRLRAIVYESFDYAQREPAVVRLILQVFFTPTGQGPSFNRVALWRSRFSRIVAVMREGQDAGELARGDPELLAMTFCGMMDMYVMARAHRPDIELTQELAGRVANLFLDGAATL